MSTAPEHNHAGADSSDAGDDAYNNVTWAFALQVLGVVVGMPLMIWFWWVMAICTGLCRQVVSQGHAVLLANAPVAVPLLCLFVSVLLCIPRLTGRRYRAIWAITCAGFVVVLIDFAVVMS